MRKLLVRPQFYEDVAGDVEYLAKRAGATTANHWAEALDRTIDSLVRQPHLGRLRNDLRPAGIRSWRMNKFKRWLVFYQVDEKALTLLRVRYGMMDLPTLDY